MTSSIKLVLMLVAGAFAEYDSYSPDLGNQLGGGYSDGGGYSAGGGFAAGGGYPAAGGGYSDGGYSGGGGSGGHGGGHGDEHHQAHPYEFGYAVKDPHYGTDFGQQETSDGHNVKGSYRVVLPDGRTQIVTYHADWKNGFHADVQYEGTAQYPEPQGHGGGYPGQQIGGGHDYAAPQDHGGFSGYTR